ncbi:expressed conserved protein [Echinococcus multilocularis]|uniref:Expressed conserved protein n=1 Tax=Echinococcus multilocularis TaxID=6211 RepID=A0A068YA54_ECHMU|nr:expressed conserved protein [Echinococcus multilocularis]
MATRPGRFFDYYTNSNVNENGKTSVQTNQSYLLSSEDHRIVPCTGDSHSDYRHEVSITDSWTQGDDIVNNVKPFNTAHQIEEICTHQTMGTCGLYDHLQSSPDDHNNRCFPKFLQPNEAKSGQSEPSDTQALSYGLDQSPCYVRYMLYVLEHNPSDPHSTEANQMTRPEDTQALSLLETTGDVRAVDFEQLNREICFQKG